MEEVDDKDIHTKLAPEDVKFQGELAEGVDRIHLKRAHSADPDGKATPESSQTPNPAGASTSQTSTTGASPLNNYLANAAGFDTPSESILQSPLKKYRPSVDHTADGINLSATQNLSAALDSVVGGGSGSGTPSTAEVHKPKAEEEEEL
ncbi:hypothetical protein NW754_004503 [Fusarium falciforme]|nr:hypothetical protein NW754_004503 [Fusarium falciforme]